MLFKMVNKTDILGYLGTLGLTQAEAIVFYELLRAPLSRLELSRATGINRTKVYRLVDQLLARGLLEENEDASGVRLGAVPLKSFERVISDGQSQIDSQRQALKALSEFTISDRRSRDLGVRSFKGQEGLRQQLWNELRDDPEEILVFSKGESLNAHFGARFSARFRAQIVSRGIRQRVLQNFEDEHEEGFSKSYKLLYHVRVLPLATLPISQEMTVLPDRVNIYSWVNSKFFGLEIRDRGYARFMSGIFERFWREAGGHRHARPDRR